MSLRITHNPTTDVFYKALFVRLLMLLFILFVAGGMERGFIGADTYYDDYRYELGGEVYAHTAQSLLDVNAFVNAYASVGDNVGYNFMRNPLDASPLWYWIVSIIMYLTKSFVSVRVFNVFVSALAVVYVYKFAEIVYGVRTASIASHLLAFLPYPVVFSCFAYKDCLIMLLTFFLFFCAAKYRIEKRFDAIEVIKIATALVCLLFTRGGLTALLLVVCILIAFSNEVKMIVKSKTVFVGLIIAIVVILVFIRSYQTIFYKLQYYLDRHSETLTGTTISYITINGITDFYKMPFSYLFSVIMPIHLFGTIDSWYSVVANANIIMTPIAVGATAYIFTPKSNRFIYWSSLMLYIVSIITSINIFRHYYSLIPLSFIAFANYTKDNRNDRRIIVYGVGLLISVFLFVYYLFR